MTESRRPASLCACVIQAPYLVGPGRMSRCPLLPLSCSWSYFLPTLTDTHTEEGEAPALRHQVGVVALVGQHLCHLPYPPLLPFLDPQKNPKANVCPS